MISLIIALSFPGEHRQFVRNVAKALAEKLGRERIFFDEWYEAELRGHGADNKLRRIYRENSNLLVPFFSEHYEKMWCQIEWHSIRAVLAQRRKDDCVVPVHLDGTRIEGWECIDLGIRRGRKSGRQIAAVLLETYRERRRSQPPKTEADTIAGRIVPFEVIGADAKPPPHRRILRDLERALATGRLRKSYLGPIVLAICA